MRVKSRALVGVGGVSALALVAFITPRILFSKHYTGHPAPTLAIANPPTIADAQPVENGTPGPEVPPVVATSTAEPVLDLQLPPTGKTPDSPPIKFSTSIEPDPAPSLEKPTDHPVVRDASPGQELSPSPAPAMATPEPEMIAQVAQASVPPAPIDTASAPVPVAADKAVEKTPESAPPLDPEKEAEAFLDRTRTQATKAIESLTKEATELRTKLARVEAGLARYRATLEALDGTQAGDIQLSPAKISGELTPVRTIDKGQETPLKKSEPLPEIPTGSKPPETKPLPEIPQPKTPAPQLPPGDELEVPKPAETPKPPELPPTTPPQSDLPPGSPQILN